MKKLLFIVAGMMSFLLIITGCGTKTEKSGPIISSDVEFGENDYEKITQANNELGFKLIHEVEADENDNLFISPTSLLMALSMVYNGADGETKEEIAQVLQVEGIDVDELNRANASFITKLDKNADKVLLKTANSIWLNENYHFQDNFAKNNKDFFNAEINEIDILDVDSAKQINDWVKAATNDKIEEIVEAPLNPHLVTLLINAIYFKGDWKYEFDKKLTENDAFLLADGTTKEVPLMTLQEDLLYMENEQFQAVKLPYGEGEMGMTIFLPKDDSNLEAFAQSLSNENWKTWASEFSATEGTIVLPKFQLEYEVLLKESLKSLGMTTAFNEQANLSKMIKEDDSLWISEVKQKTFIEVDEEGTEAAAVTSVEVKVTSAPADGPFRMIVNRPFFFTITDDETGAVLFLGSIENPQQAK